MDRRRTVLKGIDLRSGTGLEIGPLNRPLVSRAEGRVFYADHCATDALRAKYAVDPQIDVAGIVEVDFDLSAGALPDIAGAVAPFDYVVASHVAEHVPDLIGWLRAVGAVLRPGGILALVLPDKRFTLDLHRRETPLFEIEAAHAERRNRPDLRTLLDHFLNVVEVEAGSLWRHPGSGRDARHVMPTPIAAEVIERWQSGAYLDAHCWVGTPWSFLELLGAIVDRHELGFRLHWARTTPYRQLEFYVQLERTPVPGPGTDWSEAARALKRRAKLLEASGIERLIAAARRNARAFRRGPS